MNKLAQKIISSKADRLSDDFRESQSVSGHTKRDLQLDGLFGSVRLESVSLDGVEEPLRITAPLDYGLTTRYKSFEIGGSGDLVTAEFGGKVKPYDKLRVLARVAFGKVDQ